MSLPSLEDRFLEPPGWRWHKFKHKGCILRFGTASPANSIPDAVVVCLEGLSEFGEKYFEVARTCLDKNLAFWVFDWIGQGQSSRYLGNPHKRHSHGFHQDVDDLHALILGYIKHSSVHPDRGRIPLVMLAHSTGGNIGMHYLAKYPGIFECAAFTAPLLGLKAIRFLPGILAQGLAGMLNLGFNSFYIPGHTDWRECARNNPIKEMFSGDPQRRLVHNAWCLIDPSLQVGGVTFGWIYHAIKSCAELNRPGILESIQTHCLIALAGKDDFVDNGRILEAAARLPHAETIEFPESRHEILMEKDSIRSPFFDAFYTLIRERIINRPETLKPF